MNASVVRLLRQANVSLMSILRLLKETQSQAIEQTLSKEALPVTTASFEVLTAYDQLIISIKQASHNMKDIQTIIYKLIS